LAKVSKKHPRAEIADVLVEAIIAMEPEGGARGPELARRLKVSLSRVRAELNTLESLGCIYRTGAKRGTRWWVG
jgi:Mn-dependent DtxR family transcriptional regulator